MGNVGGHLAAQPVFMGHFLAHAVKSGCKLADLIVLLYDHLLFKFSLGNTMSRLGEGFEGMGERPGQEDSDEERNQQGACYGVDEGVVGALQELRFLGVETGRLAGPEDRPYPFSAHGDRGTGQQGFLWNA